MRFLSAILFILALAATATPTFAQADFREHREKTMVCADMRRIVLEKIGEGRGRLWELGSERNADGPLSQSLVNDASNWVTMILIRDLDFVHEQIQADRYLTVELCRTFLYEAGLEILSFIEHVIEKEELPYALDWVGRAKSQFADRWFYVSDPLTVQVAGQRDPHDPSKRSMPPAWREYLKQNPEAE